MKKLILPLLIFFTSTAHAQKNAFFDQAFWKSSPNVEAVKAKIAEGNSPVESNPNGFDAVVYAINSDAPIETIKFLLSYKENSPNKITHDSRTYIFWAANKGNLEVMKLLLDNGAKVNIVDSKGLSPLNFAASAGQTNTLVYDLLIKNGADLKNELSHDGANALLLSASGDTNMVLINYFISKGLKFSSADKNGNTVLNYALRSGNKNYIRTLLQKGAKFNNSIVMATQSARGREANKLDFYRFLVEEVKIDPTTSGLNGETALHNICRRPGNIEEIKYFISKGLDVNKTDKDGNTAFMFAAASADISTIEFLKNFIKDINQKNSEGYSALTYTVKNNKAEVVKYLLNKGADSKVTDIKNNNLAGELIKSFSPSKEKEFLEKMQLLENAGVNFNLPQAEGNTLYHIAIVKENLSLLKSLEHFNININAKNKDGFTVLHKAAMLATNDEILKYLISQKADKNIATEMNESVYDLAVENETLKKNKISLEFLK